jgi:adenosylcobinamide-GDP ribazoletransferase
VSVAALRSALAFLTIAGGAAAPDRRSPAWFAPVGALAGLAVGGVWWLADLAFSPLVAAVLAVAADAVVTGALHLDGLADTADGVLPPLSRERRLAVMTAPDVGAFGVAALVLALSLRVAALAALAPDPWLVVGVWAAARGAMAVTMAVVPYARPGGGLASAFGGGARGSVSAAVVGVLVAGAVVVVTASGGWVAGTAASAALVVGFAGVVALARRRLGGFTGDVLGAAGVVAETAALVVASARW